MKLACEGEDASRIDYVFSECHNGRIAATFAIRKGEWKLIEYVGYDPLLFNLADDPNEMNNLVDENPNDPIVKAKLRELRSILYSICSPEGVDLKARYEQSCMRERLAMSGRLEKELAKRGFAPSTDKLIPLD